MFSRRDFLRFGALGVGVMALRPLDRGGQADFPQADRLGRITVGKMDVYARPDGSASPVGALYEDQVFPWLREVVGSMPGRINQRFIESPNGFIWGGHVQPVRNQPNAPIVTLPRTSVAPACG